MHAPCVSLRLSKQQHAGLNLMNGVLQLQVLSQVRAAAPSVKAGLKSINQIRLLMHIHSACCWLAVHPQQGLHEHAVASFDCARG